MDYDSLLKKKVEEGLENLGLHNEKKYIDRIKTELGVIFRLGFSPYFLVMEDISRFVDSHPDLLAGIGRGSSAGSLVFYTLGVTKVDPIEYGLFFERFLNESRVSPPDCDYDVSDREIVIDYIKDKYGEDRVARVGSLNFLRTKSAVRDIGRVLEKPRNFVDELANIVPPPVAGLWEDFDYETKVEPRLLEDKYKEIIEPTRKLWGVVRSMGTHAGGIAISPVPINQVIPLYKDKDGNPVSQFDWRDLEQAGILKFDILGLSTLRVIKDCIKFVESRGEKIDIFGLHPYNDPEVYKIIQQGDLAGIFQLGGSTSIQEKTVDFCPKNLEDLSSLSAAFRPGPLISKLTDKLISIRKGESEPEYIFEELRPILEGTQGIPLFQEEIMKISTDICGYTMQDADIFRKIMGKKKKEMMDKEKTKFIDGAVGKGFSRSKVEELWESIRGVAQYLFNLSHSICYGIITYWTAYLKRYYPVEFYASLIINENNPDRVISYISSAQDKGIKFLPPDLNLSGVYHLPEGNNIRFGLSHIKNMPVAAAKKIIEIRNDQR